MSELRLIPPSTENLGQEAACTPPCFEDFWCLYVRHTAKKVALKSWERLSDADKLQAVIAAEAWRRIWQQMGTEWQYIPMPATWLNQGRYDDDYPPWFNSKPATAKIKPAGEPEAQSTRITMPDHVRAVLARLKAKL
jgi:NDP-sugar pyrophosphorylase family protein